MTDVTVTIIQPPTQVVNRLTVAQGPAGRDGDSLGADKNFEWSPPSATNVWVIPHNMGKRPSVTVIDSAGDEVEGHLAYDSVNQLTLTFSAAFSGTAYLN